MQRPFLSGTDGTAAQRRRHAFGDLILHRKHVFEPSIETVRPSVVAARHLDELHRHAEAIAGLADAALEQRLHVELFADDPDVLALPRN
jgi:hypothetical protein